MASNRTLLCIHRDPAQLSLLTEHGYELASATSGSDGLRLFRSQLVDAVVIEYHLGFMNGAAVAPEIKRIRPVPIVMVADQVELPADALRSVDALVVESDGPGFLLATVHFVLNVRPAQQIEIRLRSETPTHVRRPGRARKAATQSPPDRTELALDEKLAPFSPEVWRAVREGKMQF
jgi:DNA-binding response OmpR family regulator